MFGEIHLKSKLKSIKISFVLGMIFALSISNYYIFIIIDDASTENRDYATTKFLNLSAYWPNNPPIHIQNDNWSVIALPWIQNRTGTYEDPHIIENVTINAGGSGSAIIIENSGDYFIIRNCTVHNTGNYWGFLDADAGIKLKNTDNGMIFQNNCSNNGRNGILLVDGCLNNSIINNTANENIYYGIHMNGDCDNNIIFGNTANNNEQHGLYISGDCDNNTISGNIVCDNAFYGIYLDYNCNNNTILGNIADNSIGVWLHNQCDNNTISGNTVNHNVRGIWLYNNCDNNTISGNNANHNNEFGISLWDNCDDNEISGNSVNNNYQRGIYINGNCDDNTISRNTIYYTNQNGIILSSDCDDNLIFLNSFIGNENHARDEGNNQWDNGFFGNYWDNYSGVDFLPLDGVGDTPYSFPVNKYDLKPLIHLGWDTDGDFFIDSDEAIYGTNPLDPSWYPMPNLKALHFSPVITEEKNSFMIDFSITNNGIWKAEEIIIIVRCEELSLTLFNNTNTPLTLDVDETEYICISCSSIETIGTFTLDLIIDPSNIIEEKYSSKDGSERIDAEIDNSLTTYLTIDPEIKPLNLAIISQSFSPSEFNITFFVYNETGQGVDYTSIQMQWNDIDVSATIQNLGVGLYFVSLEAITVVSGEDPILFEIAISADGYEDINFESYISVDPVVLQKGVDFDGLPLPIIILIIALSSGGILGVTIIFWIRRRKIKE